MKLHKIKILKNNYAWILSEKNKKSIIIDPGESHKILKYIKKKKLIPYFIFLTHKHYDHISGTKKILSYFPKIKIFSTSKSIFKKNVKKIYGGEKINFFTHNIYVISTPGHTKNDMSFYCKPYLLCGDILFSSGCGKSFKKGKEKKLYKSIRKILKFPENTIICCGHEYTKKNAYFAKCCYPLDKKITSYYKEIKHKNPVPTTLKIEKKVNIFLRTKEKKIQKIFKKKQNYKNSFNCFKWLRRKKDKFKKTKLQK